MAKPTLVNAATKYDPNHEYELKVSDIFVDWKWNTRVNVADTNPDTQTDEAGFQELVVSMAKDGQRTACVVRPNPYKGKGSHPGSKYEYMLVEGFGRTRAKSELAAGEHGILLGANGVVQVEADKLKTKEPTIRAKVISMTEAEARKRNLGENMLRSQLTAPDIAFGINKLAEAEPSASNLQLGAMIGRSEPYVAKLRRIYSTFKDVTVPADALWKGSPPMPVTQAWRCAPKKAMNEDMLAVADVDAKTPLAPEEKLAKYLIASGVTLDPEAKPKKKVGQGAWAENACIDAKAFGALLGALDRIGAIEIIGVEPDWWAMIVPKYEGKADKATDDNKEAIVYAFNEGVKEGRKVPKAKESKPAAKGKSVPKAPESKTSVKASAAKKKSAAKSK